MKNPQAENDIRINRFGNESYKPVINVNSKYGRLYFSVFAIKALHLDQGNFKLFKRGSRWFLTKTAAPGDFAMKVHQGAYYIVSKELTFKLVSHFHHHKPSFLIEGTDRKRKCYVLSFFVPVLTKKKHRRTQTKTPYAKRKDPKVISAENVIAKFENTNFAGRVKTVEILKAEQILNRS